jgi:tRNA dimethylallyltransferase
LNTQVYSTTCSLQACEINMSKTCIIIQGPTAVGKTALAVQVAKHFSTEIISADSRQCYNELNIGVAKPSKEELEQVPHHFINSHSIADDINAAVFETYALNKVNGIFDKNNIAVMVGGTGLYIKAFCSGLDEVPIIQPGIRDQIILDYQERGITWLQEEVKRNDPIYFAVGEIKNPQRLMRALEVIISTGQSIVAFQKSTAIKRDFKIINIGLELPKEELYNRINNRVDTMMSDGLLEEVKRLEPYQHLNALQTVGYKELFIFLKGETQLPLAIENIRKNTRHYAKRQLTWFKKDNTITWCQPLYDEVMESLEKRITE